MKGRYAPSPSGELHLGNASTALVAWLSARSRGGAFVVRIEDLDRQRSRPDLARRILEDLAWLGLDWDEGPDRGGPHGPYEQRARLPRYAEAFERLRRDGRVYPCFCSRRDVASAVHAPQAPGDERPYPGTCRGMDPELAARRVASGERHSWRFRADGRASFVDRVCGPYGADAPAPGDFVVFRADGVPAYQLAVVVDDDAMRITEVVRGADLLPSTLKQLLLLAALALDPPDYGHVPLLLGPDGVRLAKRHGAISVRELRERGCGAPELIGRLAHVLGLRPDPAPVPAAALLPGFELGALPAAREGVRIHPGAWKCV